jgi:hypothetical protein
MWFQRCSNVVFGLALMVGFLSGCLVPASRGDDDDAANDDDVANDDDGANDDDAANDDDSADDDDSSSPSDDDDSVEEQVGTFSILRDPPAPLGLPSQGLEQLSAVYADFTFPSSTEDEWSLRGVFASQGLNCSSLSAYFLILDEAMSAFDPALSPEENNALRLAAIAEAASEHLGAPCWIASIDLDPSFELTVGPVPPESVNGIQAGFLELPPGGGPNSNPFFDLLGDATFSLNIKEVGERLVGSGQAEGSWYESTGDKMGSGSNVELHPSTLTLEFDVPYCIIN